MHKIESQDFVKQNLRISNQNRLQEESRLAPEGELRVLGWKWQEKRGSQESSFSKWQADGGPSGSLKASKESVNPAEAP